MTRLVISDVREHWETCSICGHKINPMVGVCDLAYTHLPCTHSGCLPEFHEEDEPVERIQAAFEAGEKTVTREPGQPNT